MNQFMGTSRWYALRTRSRHEKIVREQLANQGIEPLLPTVKRLSQWKDRKKEVEVPLFSGYCFVRFGMDQKLPVLKTVGVVDIVGGGRQPEPIPDEEIAAMAREWGAETPFLRPAEFSQDKTTDLPVFEHALKWLAENESYGPDVVIQLRPTSPIRPRNCVDAAVRILLEHNDADSVRGIVPSGQNPHKMWRLLAGEHGPMKNLLDVEGIDEPYNAPRQILPPIYWQTGHVDAIRSRTILEGGSMSGGVIYPRLGNDETGVPGAHLATSDPDPLVVHHANHPPSTTRLCPVT